MKKRIFYFNLTLSCNNNCIFCYSHNTCLSEKEIKGIQYGEFISYLEKFELNENDRVVLSGGEPLIHSQFLQIIEYLIQKDCEIVIFTNGKKLSEVPADFFSQKVRIVVPIHGDEEIHDYITKSQNSFQDTIRGIYTIRKNNPKTIIELKVILHPYMISDEDAFMRTMDAIVSIPINGMIHLTKMADTKKSIENECYSLSLEEASYYTYRAFDFLKEKANGIKLFNTCISKIKVLDNTRVISCSDDIVVYGKDYAHFQEHEVVQERGCCDNDLCQYRECCLSVIDQYLALEYQDGKFQEIVEME